MRVALIACGSQKLPSAAPAKDLYTGNLFRLSRAWVCDSGTYPSGATRPPRLGTLFSAWGVLSAKHGLLLPDQIVEPYDVSLSNFSRDERAEWAKSVVQEIVDEWGAATIYTVLSGRMYVGDLHKLPFVEDLFGGWLDFRRTQGKRGRVGIGWLMRELKSGRGRT